MIILGIILLVLGLFLWRPLAYAGGLLLILGVVLYLVDVAGPVGGHWY